MIDIALATKYRVDSVIRTVKSILDTTDELGRICICYDSDDDETIAAKDKILQLAPNNIKLSVSPVNGSCVKAINHSIGKTKADYVCLIGDDAIFKTKHWDTLSISLFDKNPDYHCLTFFTDKEKLRKTFKVFYYPFFCVFKRDALIKLNGMDEKYVRAAADQQLAVDMLLNDMLMMICKDIVIEHDRQQDKLIKKNKRQGNKDNQLFKKRWLPKKNMILEKYEKVKDKWGKLVSIF